MHVSDDAFESMQWALFCHAISLLKKRRRMWEKLVENRGVNSEKTV